MTIENLPLPSTIRYRIEQAPRRAGNPQLPGAPWRTVRGKTGMMRPGTPGAIGWFVGWVERGGDRWFVAVNIDMTDARLIPKRVELARAALAAAGAFGNAPAVVAAAR